MVSSNVFVERRNHNLKTKLDKDLDDRAYDACSMKTLYM